jgi:hypothetical protein
MLILLPCLFPGSCSVLPYHAYTVAMSVRWELLSVLPYHAYTVAMSHSDAHFAMFSLKELQ